MCSSPTTTCARRWASATTPSSSATAACWRRARLRDRGQRRSVRRCTWANTLSACDEAWTVAARLAAPCIDPPAPAVHPAAAVVHARTLAGSRADARRKPVPRTQCRRSPARNLAWKPPTRPHRPTTTVPMMLCFQELPAQTVLALTAKTTLKSPVGLGRAGDWSGDGTVEMAPNDAEWGGDAPARTRNDAEGDEADATELARSHESLHRICTARHCRCACPRWTRPRCVFHRIAERRRLPRRAAGRAGHQPGRARRPGADRRTGAPLHRGPAPAAKPGAVGVGARNLSECLTLQLTALAVPMKTATPTPRPCRPLCASASSRWRCWPAGHPPPDAAVQRRWRGGEERTRLRSSPAWNHARAASFADVERNIIVPDVIVRKAGRANGSGQQNFIVQLNPDVMPACACTTSTRGALRGGKGAKAAPGHAAAPAGARWFIKNIQQRFDHPARLARHRRAQKNFSPTVNWPCAPGAARHCRRTGLHESTISRVTTAKYMATPSAPTS